ncbi:MAG: IS3 family transposase [Chloroflexi bacterium]|nr:IS3 family transposase [Chloroflexota bacterium]
MGLLFHSDRGSQYASDDFVDLIGVFEVTQSMSRAAEVYDNAVMETRSVFASYKTECVPADGFETRAQAKSETFEYIEVFYNRQRLHSTLGYLTPVEAEQAVGIS